MPDWKFFKISPNLGLFFVPIPDPASGEDGTGFGNMSGFILGQKGEMSQTFDEGGARIPITYVKTSPCYLIDIWPNGTDAVTVKLGFGTTAKIAKPILGTLKKAGITTPLRFIREIRLDTSEFLDRDRKGVKIGDNEIYTGDPVKPSLVFKVGDLIQVTGVSKGKGFAGVVKRHHFKGGPRTHGQSDRERAPGSIGQTTTPGRVYKGKRMAGRMGGDRITIKKLKIVEVKDDEIIVKGLVPGAKGGLLIIKN